MTNVDFPRSERRNSERVIWWQTMAGSCMAGLNRWARVRRSATSEFPRSFVFLCAIVPCGDRIHPIESPALRGRPAPRLHLENNYPLANLYVIMLQQNAMETDGFACSARTFVRPGNGLRIALLSLSNGVPKGQESRTN